MTMVASPRVAVLFSDAFYGAFREGQGARANASRNSSKRPSGIKFRGPFRQAASVIARSPREAARETQRVSKMFVFDCEALRRSINLDV